MKYSKILKIEKQASKIVYGCAIQDMLDGKNCNELLSSVTESGINFFDTARVYGKSEISLGKWLVNQNTDNLVIQTKCCHFDEKGARVGRTYALEDIQTSLENLKIDKVDALLLHRDDKSVSVEEIIDFMNEIIFKGYATAIGVSNWTTERIIKANAYAKAHGLTPFTITSPYYGLAEQFNEVYLDGEHLTGKEKQEEREKINEEKLSVVAYSALANGFFSGNYTASDMLNGNIPQKAKKGYLHPDNIERLRRTEQLAKQKGVTVSQIALAWLLTDEMDTYAVVGCSRKETIESTIKSCEITLTQEERKYLNLGI